MLSKSYYLTRAQLGTSDDESDEGNVCAWRGNHEVSARGRLRRRQRSGGADDATHDPRNEGGNIDDADGAVAADYGNLDVNRLPYSITFFFAKWTRQQAIRRVRTLTSMALVSSLGGGWASVRDAPKARFCALVLGRLAESVGDDATVRKCRVFEAYALMWEGRAVASRTTFDGERVRSAQEGDELNEGRAEAGMRILLWDMGQQRQQLRQISVGARFR